MGRGHLFMVGHQSDRLGHQRKPLGILGNLGRRCSAYLVPPKKIVALSDCSPQCDTATRRIRGCSSVWLWPNDSYPRVSFGQASGTREPCTNFVEVSVLVCVEPAVCMSSDLLTKPEFKSPVVQDAFADEGPDRLAQLLELYRQLLGGTHWPPDKMHSVRTHAPPQHDFRNRDDEKQ